MKNLVPFGDISNLQIPLNERIAWMAEQMLLRGYLDIKGGTLTIAYEAEPYFIWGKLSTYFTRVLPRMGSLKTLGTHNSIRYYVLILREHEYLYFMYYNFELKEVFLQDMPPEMLVLMRDLKKIPLAKVY